MGLHHFKCRAFLYATIVLLLKGFTDIYFFNSTAFVYYVIISFLILIGIIFIVLFILPPDKPGKIYPLPDKSFLMNLTHGFKMPVIAIIGAAELMEHEHLSLTQTEHIEIIKKSGHDLLQICCNIIEANRLELGQAEIDPQASSLHAMMQSCVLEAASSLACKGLQLKMDLIEEADIVLMVDVPKLKQIVNTLLNKAIENAQGGSINLKTRVEKATGSDNHLFISIGYYGSETEMPAENPLTNINQQSPTEDFKDHLDLYCCRMLAEFMGGNFWISVHGEKNTTFQFYLPVKIAVTEYIDKPQPAHEKKENLLSPVKVLLVEDNAFNIRIISQMLSNYGFEVTLAENGLQCLQILQEKIFDVILMDMQMPVMDGYEASRIISRDTYLGSIPIIAVTANAMIGDREKCMASGCAAYLAKPFQSRELIQEIENIVKNKKILRITADSVPEKSHAYEKEFLKELANSVKDLEEAADNDDWELIKNRCYEIKVLAGIHICKEIFDLASLIEVAAGKRMNKIIALNLIELRIYCENLLLTNKKTGTSLE